LSTSLMPDRSQVAEQTGRNLIDKEKRKKETTLADSGRTGAVADATPRIQ